MPEPMMGGAAPPTPQAPMAGMSPAVMQQLAQRQGSPGPTPATTATPNAGLHAAGVALIGKIIKGIEMAIPLVGSGSEAGQALIDSLKKLGKFAQPGEMSPGIDKTEEDKMALMQRQMGPAAGAQRASAPPSPATMGMSSAA